MDNIQDKIYQLMIERTAIKIEVNSQYPTGTDFTDLIERISLITTEVKQLSNILDRNKKLKKIKERYEDKKRICK